LLVPLADSFTVADLIVRLRCEVLIVAANRLGTINHTLLTARVLTDLCKKRKTHPANTPGGVRVVLMGQQAPDASSSSNPSVLKALLHPIPVTSVRFLGANLLHLRKVSASEKKIEKSLATLLA
jgi:hypothetical protein